MDTMKQTHVQDIPVVVTFNPTIRETKATFAPLQTNAQHLVEKETKVQSEQQNEKEDEPSLENAANRFTVPKKSLDHSATTVKKRSPAKKGDKKQPKVKRKQPQFLDEGDDSTEPLSERLQDVVRSCDQSCDQSSPSAESANSTREQSLGNERITYPRLTTSNDGTQNPSV